MARKWVTPKPPANKDEPPRQVPVPAPHYGYLPAEGKNVEFDIYWMRREQDGDITVEDERPEPEEKPAKADKK